MTTIMVATVLSQRLAYQTACCAFRITSFSANGRHPTTFHRHNKWTTSSKTPSIVMEMTQESSAERSKSLQKQSCVTLLEHVNINIPDHTHGLPFFIDILGMGLDPRRAQNVASGKGTLWANCGPSQFHLPHGDVPQVVPGSIGLAYESLQALKDRLSTAAATDAKCFKEYEVGIDSKSNREYVRVVDMYGNVFFCRERSPSPDIISLEVINDDKSTSVQQQQLNQPILKKDDIADDAVEKYGLDVIDKYRKQVSECLGIDYVEFRVPRKGDTVTKIANFYQFALEAPAQVVQDGNDKVAIVGIGAIDSSTGRCSQCLLFRESDEAIPEYDGHHVALYCGTNDEDFNDVFQNCLQAGIVWVNERFSDKVRDLAGAQKAKQFRFKNILDLKTGETVFTLEHEIRSVNHDAWPGKAI